MVTTDEFKFVTARAYPRMLLIQPAITGDLMTLSSPDISDISLSFSTLKTLSPISSAVWSQTVKIVDCGDEVAAWLSKHILGKESGMRLVFYPYDKPSRQFKAGNHRYDTLAPIDVVI